MALLNSGRRNQYTATGGQTVFAYSFEIFDSGDLLVYAGDTLLTESTNYTVAGVGSDSGGSITLTAPATAGVIYTLIRSTEQSRNTDYQESGAFLASEVNADFDRLLAMIQENAEETGRSVQFSSTSTQPLPVNIEKGVAGNLLAWNAGATGITSLTLGSVTGGELVADLTPQLGGDLDLNTHDITGTGNIDITGDANIGGDATIAGDLTAPSLLGDVTIAGDISAATLTASSGGSFGSLITAPSLNLGASTEVSSVLDEDDMTSNSAAALATQQSIKAYVDNNTSYQFISETVVDTPVSSVDIALEPATYSSHVLIIDNVSIQTSTQSLGIRLSTDGGSTFIDAANSYDVQRSRFNSTASYSSGGSTLMIIATGVSSLTTLGLGGTIRIIGSDSGYTRVNSQVGFAQPGPVPAQDLATAMVVGNTSPMNAIRILSTSGNVTTGRFRLYGVI